MNESFQTLENVLSPQGIKTVTTGGDEVGRFLQARFGSVDERTVRHAWKANLRAIVDADVVVIGVPMDAGAGFERGSFKGPLGMRTALLAHDVYAAFDSLNVVDVGDVRVNPHLVDDAYYRPELLQRVREDRGTLRGLPVAPHSAFRAALEAIRDLNPNARVVHLGGDHSTSRIPCEWLTENDRNDAQDLGILHFDAHTDLLRERDGVPHNFATWAYHANDRIGRGRRLLQLGIRVSGHPADYWERELDLIQIRAGEIAETPMQQVIDRVVSHFDSVGVRRLYISNDIDATDPTYAASTGTMETDGLQPEFVSAMIAAAGESFDIVAADVVEVAPPLKWHVPGEPARTIATACRYLVDTLQAMTGKRATTAFDRIEPATPEQVAATPSFVQD